MKKDKLTYTDGDEKVTVSGTLVPFPDTADLYRFYTKHELPSHIKDYFTDSGEKLEICDTTDYGRVRVAKMAKGDVEGE